MTKQDLEKIKTYLEKNKALRNTFSNNSKIYSMTTENISDFLYRYNLKDKKVLTVAGSGDQRLNSLLYGAKEVTCFDINPLTKLHMDLKDEMIKNVDLDDFLSFFGVRTKTNEIDYETLNNRTFERVKDNIDELTYDFFNYVINQSLYTLPRDIYYSLGDTYELQNKMNNYLTKEKYLELRKILENQKINFIETDVKDIKEKIKDEKYDFILLSNISDYVHHIYPSKELKMYRELIDSLKDNLNDQGVIEVGYLYSYYTRGEDVSDFHFNYERRLHFPTEDFRSVFVNSYYDDGTYDKIITYQKVL